MAEQIKWYQRKTVQAAVVAVGVAILSFIGLEVDPTVQQSILDTIAGLCS